MSSKQILIFIAVCAVIILAAVFAISRISEATNKKYDSFVSSYSVTLSALNEINSSFKFKKYEIIELSHSYDNEVFYNNVSCEDYLIYNLQYDQRGILTSIAASEWNEKLYPQYEKRVAQITEFGKFSAPIGKLKIKRLISIEKRLYQRKLYSRPRKFCVRIYLRKTDLNGRCFGWKNDVFGADEVRALIKRINNRSGYFYNDKGIWDAICRVERAKVSNKMRFSIYARDGYRCRYCGKRDNGNNLEIDHIKPIAKGGKSTYDNLQTLCRRCNKNKGDTY